jgi:hypothetical protein
MLPLYVLQMRGFQPLAKAMPEFRYVNSLLVNSNFGKAKKVAYGTSLYRGIAKEYDVKWGRTLGYAFMQAPIFMTFVWSVRRLCVTDEIAKTGGFAWFTDLSVADP